MVFRMQWKKAGRLSNLKPALSYLLFSPFNEEFLEGGQGFNAICNR